MKKIYLLVCTFYVVILSAQAPTNGLISYFPFSGTYSSTNNLHQFVKFDNSLADVPYVAGKYGQGVSFSQNGQCLKNLTSISNAIATTTPFSIAFWQKPNSSTDAFRTTFEGFQTLSFRNRSTYNELYVATSFTQSYQPQIDQLNAADFGVWKHYVITTSSASGERRLVLYVDGVLANSCPFPVLMKFTTLFTIGGGVDGLEAFLNSKRFSGVIDEFYIYSRELTVTEMGLIRNDSSLALNSKRFNDTNLSFNLYPNPASNSLNIEIANELKSIEIYSVLGHKVLSGKEKQLNISNLASGLYMVRVTAVDGSVATHKFVKE